MTHFLLFLYFFFINKMTFGNYSSCSQQKSWGRKVLNFLIFCLTKNMWWKSNASGKLSSNFSALPSHFRSSSFVFLCWHVRRPGVVITIQHGWSSCRSEMWTRQKQKCFFMKISSPGFCVSTSMSGSGLTSPISSRAAGLLPCIVVDLCKSKVISILVWRRRCRAFWWEEEKCDES